MRAVQLKSFEGPGGLVVADVVRPTPGPDEVLLEVKAAGLNWAELEQTRGRYPFTRPLPATMGFEAAGVVVEVGERVAALRPGDRVAGLATSGGFAEYATVAAGSVIPIPEGVSFADATTLTIQGLSAYALLELAARPRPDDIVLVQAAAGGVGSFLVQLAKLRGVRRVIALARGRDKVALVEGLGADAAIDYGAPGWPERVRAATDGRGVDVALEMSSGEVQEESFKLLAPFGRIVIFGAKNMHDTIGPERMQRLIANNQTVQFFNVPTQSPAALAACVPPLLELVVAGKLRLITQHRFALADAADAFAALSGRRTVGKVVLLP
jgi:NADPH2:quinone reductase